MHSFNNNETINLLNKINSATKIRRQHLNNSPMEMWHSQHLIDKVIENMMFFKKIFDQPNFEGIKHAILCQEFNKANIEYLEINYMFEPTVLGQLNEHFHWVFQLERANSTEKKLNKIIDNQVALIQENNEYYNERRGSLRYNSLLRQHDHVKEIFLYLKDALTDIGDDHLLSICALIMLDLEKMSSSRQYDFLSYQNMFDSQNSSDKWTSCLIINASYKKLKIILPSENTLNT